MEELNWKYWYTDVGIRMLTKTRTSTHTRNATVSVL